MKTGKLLLLAALLVSCSQAPKDRTIPFEKIENGRELGGLVMQDGRSIRPGKLVRSGELSLASDQDVAILKKRFNLTNVYDFRLDAEADAKPDRPMDGVTVTHLSTLPQAFTAAFSSGKTDTTKTLSSNMLETLAKYAFLPQAQAMADKLYPAIVMDTLSQRRYGEFLKGVLDAEGGVLWHCSQGKDRCGWGSAFVLAALGADRQTIVDDFALSNVSYAPAVEALSERITQMGGGEGELSFIRSMVGVNVENFESTLDLIDAKYGSLEAYLEQALGFSAEEQTALRKKLLK